MKAKKWFITVDTESEGRRTSTNVTLSLCVQRNLKSFNWELAAHRRLQKLALFLLKIFTAVFLFSPHDYENLRFDIVFVMYHTWDHDLWCLHVHRDWQTVGINLVFLTLKTAHWRHWKGWQLFAAGVPFPILSPRIWTVVLLIRNDAVYYSARLNFVARQILSSVAYILK